MPRLPWLLNLCPRRMRRALPVQECRKNPHTVLVVTDTGGHCGHVQALWPLGRSYLDDTAVRFCRAVLSNTVELEAEQ